MLAPNMDAIAVGAGCGGRKPWVTDKEVSKEDLQKAVEELEEEDG